MKILIAEDEISIANALKAMLTKMELEKKNLCYHNRHRCHNLRNHRNPPSLPVPNSMMIFPRSFNTCFASLPYIPMLKMKW